MALLTREDLLSADRRPKCPQETVPVPALGGDVIVRGLTASEQDDFDAKRSIGDGDNRRLDVRNFRARLVARCLVDETGARLLGDHETAVIGDLPSEVVQPLFEVAVRLNGMGARKEDVEGFTSTPDAASASA